MMLPKRIILVRHGESRGNADKKVYAATPDHKVQLTEEGKEQAKEAGERIRHLVSQSGKVYFYVSPFVRTRETLKEITAAFDTNVVVGVREESRVREMNYGNFKDPVKMKDYKKERAKYGKFFYRFPGGESAADVSDRVSSFVDSLWKDIDTYNDGKDELNVVIISHGMTVRVLLMCFFKWTADQVDNLVSPTNAEVRTMELGYEGQYSLAFHHDDQSLQKWGLSSEMIADQKLRAFGSMVMADDNCS